MNRYQALGIGCFAMAIVVSILSLNSYYNRPPGILILMCLGFGFLLMIGGSKE